MSAFGDLVNDLLNTLGKDKLPILSAVGLQLLYISLLVIPFWWKFGLVIVPIFAVIKYLGPEVKTVVDGQPCGNVPVDVEIQKGR